MQAARREELANQRDLDKLQAAKVQLAAAMQQQGELAASPLRTSTRPNSANSPSGRRPASALAGAASRGVAGEGQISGMGLGATAGVHSHRPLSGPPASVWQPHTRPHSPLRRPDSGSATGRAGNSRGSRCSGASTPAPMQPQCVTSVVAASGSSSSGSRPGSASAPAATLSRHNTMPFMGGIIWEEGEVLTRDGFSLFLPE